MKDGIVGMYVHQHWPYHHPYAARTWNLEDWRGYAAGLRELGFNTLLIWPVVETMPLPLLPSDRENLGKLGQVIDLLHEQLDMRVYLALCPNVVAHDEVASRASFAQRHFFYCDRRVDPADRQAVEAGHPGCEELGRFSRAADTWQAVHGYENRWWCPPLTEALKQLHSLVLDQVLGFEPEALTPFGKVQADYLAAETHTPRMLAALRKYLA